MDEAELEWRQVRSTAVAVAVAMTVAEEEDPKTTSHVKRERQVARTGGWLAEEGRERLLRLGGTRQDISTRRYTEQRDHLWVCVCKCLDPGMVLGRGKRNTAASDARCRTLGRGRGRGIDIGRGGGGGGKLHRPGPAVETIIQTVSTYCT